MAWTIQLINESGRPLVPYPAAPGAGGRRAANPLLKVGLGGRQTLALDAEHAALYVFGQLPQSPGLPNACEVRLDLAGSDPSLTVLTYALRALPGSEEEADGAPPAPLEEFRFGRLKEGTHVLVAGHQLLGFQLERTGAGLRGGCALWPLLFAAGGLLARRLA